jgi:hypothetical protein
MELKRLREWLYLVLLVRSGRVFTLTHVELRRFQH